MKRSTVAGTITIGRSERAYALGVDDVDTRVDAVFRTVQVNPDVFLGAMVGTAKQYLTGR